MAGPGPGPARGGAGHRGGHRAAARHVRQHRRPLVLRARRRHRRVASRRSSTSATSSTSASTRPRGRLFPYAASTLHAPVRPWERADDCHRRATLPAADLEKRDELVTLTIDGVEVSVPKGTLLIRAAELIGVQIPRFCDHPLLDPVGACRQCLVEVTDAGNGRRDAQAAGVLHARRSRPAWWYEDAGHVAGGRQGAAGDDGVPAGQPPARLPGLRQGRRVPAAEPGDEQRPRRDPVQGDQAHLRQADQDLRAGAARPRALRAVRALHPVLRADRRRPVHRDARARRAAAGGHLRGGAVRVLLLRQHHPDLPGGRADQRRLPVPGAAVRPGLDAVRGRARRLRLGDPRRPPPRQGDAPAGRRRSRGQRGVDHRQGPLRLHLHHAWTTG